MTVKKKSSGISDHKVKKGVLVSPLNDALGDTLKLSSWALERMPEYLWLGLILLRYGRKEGLERAGKILSEISKNIENLLLPRLSLIFGLPDYDQREVYDVIGNYVDKETIAPLTLIYKKKYYPIFNEYFYVSHFSFEERFKLITKAIELYSPHQANEATDLRFLAVSLLLFTGKLVFVKGTEMTATAFTEYAYTNHNDEKMRLKK